MISSLRQAWLRLCALFKKKELDADFDEELAAHLEIAAEDYRKLGMAPAEAMRQARLSLGSSAAAKELHRETRGWMWLETALLDLRYAFRTLRHSPGFAAVCVFILAIAIGANTAVFSVIDGVLLRALPFKEPSKLVAVNQYLGHSEGIFAFSYPDFLDCQRTSTAFTAMAAFRHRGVNMTAPGEPQYLHVMSVSSSLLSVLGVAPAIGRNFDAAEEHLGAGRVTMISHALWMQRFNGSRDALGATLVLNGRAYTVIGVIPATFRLFEDSALFTLMGQDDDLQLKRRDMHPGIRAVARLKPGITLEQANSELSIIGTRVDREHPDTNANMTFRADPLKRSIVGDVGPTLLLLAGAVGLVLLIACANLGNLFLTRSLSRSRELAIRSALGASQGRLIRQLLTESVLLGVTGGLLGVLLASASTHWILLHMPNWLPRTGEIVIDGQVLAFALAASVLTGILFGVFPAYRQRAALNAELTAGTRGSTRGIRRIQGAFVIAEVALALTLLTGAGLMIRTIARLWSVDPGFDPHHVLTMTVGLSPTALQNGATIRAGWARVLSQVQNIPGVEAAAMDSLVPMSGDDDHVGYWTTRPPQNPPMAMLYTPTPDIFKVLKISLKKGRLFTEHDRVGSEPVAIVDETLANRTFPNGDAVGRELNIQILGHVRIVGEVAATKHMSLDEDGGARAEPAIYLPFLQFPDQFLRLTTNGLPLLVRTSVNPLSIVDAIKASVLGPGKDQPVRDLFTMEQMIRDSLARRRAMLILLGTFAALALLLSATGIYGVISYWTRQREREIGVRIALGAESRDVLRMFLTQGLRMAAAGIVIGTMVSLVSVRLMAKLLYGVSPLDPVTFGFVPIALCLVAGAAVYFPARRAARADPMEVLRHD